jgi:hypothetical protein
MMLGGCDDGITVCWGWTPHDETLSALAGCSAILVMAILSALAERPSILGWCDFGSTISCSWTSHDAGMVWWWKHCQLRLDIPWYLDGVVMETLAISSGRTSNDAGIWCYDWNTVCLGQTSHDTGMVWWWKHVLYAQAGCRSLRFFITDYSDCWLIFLIIFITAPSTSLALFIIS